MSSDNPTAGNYAELTVNGRRLIIEIVREDGERILGYRVNRDGSRWDRETSTAWMQELVVGLRKNIRRRLALDLVFGELVETK